ncbi:MAG: vitamin K epoxide reductase family protein [Bryobacteraceae bacterium]
MTARNAVLAISAVSALAMLYVGAYQIRAVEHLKCPLLKHGCEVVADAPFARPFGIPDGFIAAGLYGVLVLFALISPEMQGIRYSVRGLALLAAIANVVGVVDMTRLGAYCFFCLLTTLLAPFLAWAAFAF